MNLSEMISELWEILRAKGYQGDFYDTADAVALMMGKHHRNELFEDQYLKIELERLRIQRGKAKDCNGTGTPYG